MLFVSLDLVPDCDVDLVPDHFHSFYSFYSDSDLDPFQINNGVEIDLVEIDLVEIEVVELQDHDRMQRIRSARSLKDCNKHKTFHFKSRRCC